MPARTKLIQGTFILTFVHGLLPRRHPVANILKLSRFYIPDSFFLFFFP